MHSKPRHIPAGVSVQRLLLPAPERSITSQSRSSGDIQRIGWIVGSRQSAIRIEPICYYYRLHDAFHGDTSLATLDSAKIVPVQQGQFGQFFLRVAASFAELPQP